MSRPTIPLRPSSIQLRCDQAAGWPKARFDSGHALNEGAATNMTGALGHWIHKQVQHVFCPPSQWRPDTRTHAIRLAQPAARATLALALATLLSGVFWAATNPSSVAKQITASRGRAASLPGFLNTRVGVAYVGSKACAECHADIAQEFSQTDMGRSIFAADDSSRMPPLAGPVTIDDKPAHHYDQVCRQGDSVYQSEYALDSHGQEVYRHTEKLAFGVGAGENGYSFIIDRGGFLFQAPLSFYSRTGKWDLSPGHELGFDRPILSGCIVCHTGRAQPVPGRDGLYKQPAFAELAIGCENCHGPGALHVKARQQGQPVASGGDPTIVNPSRLPGWMADNVCTFCHQSGDAVVLTPGKTLEDFRPGTPLDRTVAIFSLPFKEKPQGVSPLLGHYSLMIMSRCYQGSGAKLSCITCHDPHRVVTAAEAPAYYRAKCLGCHDESSCKIPIAARSAQSPPDDCAGCHMPKRSLKTIAHSALTDHRIIRTRDEPFPKDAFAPQPGEDGLDLLDAEPGRAAPSNPLILALAYAQILNEQPADRGRLEDLLRKVDSRAQDNPTVLDLLARSTLEDEGSNGYGVAIQELERSVQLGTTWPEDYQLLGDLLRSTGRDADAISILNRGIALNPYLSSFYLTLAACYKKESDPARARQALEDGERLFPEDEAIRKALDKLEKRPRKQPARESSKHPVGRLIHQ
jgi:hypothetical protein